MPKTVNRLPAKKKLKDVYEFPNWGPRFEMDGEYHRKNGLDYIRMYVTAATVGKSNESTEFLSQLEELAYYYPEHRDAFEGRFWRLARLTATQEDWLRGFLVSSDGTPLTETKLAARLHLSLKDMRTTLRALVRVGLLRKVPCPSFERAEAKPAEEQPAKSRKKHKKTARKKTSSKATKSSISENSGTFPNSSEPLNKGNRSTKEKKKESNDSKKNSEAQRGSKRVTGIPQEENKAGSKANAQEKEKRDKTTQRREPAKPDVPTESDALERKQDAYPSMPAPGSANAAAAHTLNRGLLSGAVYDRHDVQFARKVFFALQLPGDPDNGSIDETTSFASTWHKIRQQDPRASPAAVDQLAMRLIKEAEKIGRKRGRMNRAAVWNSTAWKIAGSDKYRA